MTLEGWFSSFSQRILYTLYSLLDTVYIDRRIVEDPACSACRSALPLRRKNSFIRRCIIYAIFQRIFPPPLRPSLARLHYICYENILT
jgi:hypothetical protein